MANRYQRKNAKNGPCCFICFFITCKKILVPAGRFVPYLTIRLLLIFSADSNRERQLPESEAGGSMQPTASKKTKRRKTKIAGKSRLDLSEEDDSDDDVIVLLPAASVITSHRCACVPSLVKPSSSCNHCCGAGPFLTGSCSAPAPTTIKSRYRYTFNHFKFVFTTSHLPKIHLFLSMVFLISI